MPTSPKVAADSSVAVIGGSCCSVPQVAMVEEDVASLLIDGDLSRNSFETWWNPFGTCPVASRQDSQEAVGRRGGIEVDGEGDSRPHIEMGSRLAVGVPADARVGRSRIWTGILEDDAELLIVEEPDMVAKEMTVDLDQDGFVHESVCSG
jgi:hypothetical protein